METRHIDNVQCQSYCSACVRWDVTNSTHFTSYRNMSKHVITSCQKCRTISLTLHVVNMSSLHQQSC